MDDQLSFTDMEYTQRRKLTKREVFLNQMDALLPWEDWVALVRPHYPAGKRGRRPRSIETMLRMLLLQEWFHLSATGTEDAIYDSYAMKTFMHLSFSQKEQVPDATTLSKFRRLLSDHGLLDMLFTQLDQVLAQRKLAVRSGSIMDAAIIKTAEAGKQTDQSL